jgi:hypothetical protein
MFLNIAAKRIRPTEDKMIWVTAQITQIADAIKILDEPSTGQLIRCWTISVNVDSPLLRESIRHAR